MPPAAPKKIDPKMTRAYLAIWGVVILAAFIAAAFYMNGYRIGSSLEPVHVGALSVRVAEPGLSIFIDNVERNAAFENGGYAVAGLVPGLHSILLSKEGFWPWMKTFLIESKATTVLTPALFPVNIAKTLIAPGDPRAQKVQKLIEKNAPPEPREPSADWNPDAQSLAAWVKANLKDAVISADGNEALWVEGKSIYIGWISEKEPLPHYFCETGNVCRFVLPVVDLTLPIRNVAFYGTRDDVILFASGPALYSIEASKEGVQNFEPFYRGNAPAFYEGSDGTLYVKDGASLFGATL